MADISERGGQPYADRSPSLSGRRLRLKTGMAVLREYDHVLSAAILEELETLYGLYVELGYPEH